MKGNHLFSGSRKLSVGSVTKKFIYIFSAAILFVFTISSTSVMSAQEHFRLDPATSEVHFTLDATGHAVEGTFKVSKGDVQFNSAESSIGGTIAVDATSGSSDNKSRDKKMNSDQLKSQSFPLVTFTPTKIKGAVAATGDSKIEVEGTFTLIGQAHTITVPLLVHRDGSKATATGSFQVPFVAWGVKDPSIIFLKVGKEVKIDLKLAGTIGQ